MYSVVSSQFYQDVQSFRMIHWMSSATMSNVALNTLDFCVVWFQLNLHSIAPQTLIHSMSRNFRCLNELTETWIRLQEVMNSYLVCLIKLILSSNAVPSADFSFRLSKQKTKPEEKMNLKWCLTHSDKHLELLFVLLRIPLQSAFNTVCSHELTQCHIQKLGEKANN